MLSICPTVLIKRKPNFSRIDNPLAHLDLPRIRESADAFARRINPGSPDLEFWRKAALVALYQQALYKCRRIRNLSVDELLAIELDRKKGFWEQPKPLRLTIVTLCLSAIVQGWVQTGLVSEFVHSMPEVCANDNRMGQTQNGPRSLA